MAEYSLGDNPQLERAAADRPEARTDDDVHFYEFPFRKTGMGEMISSFVYCATCGKILEPTGKKRSRTGNHGYDYYIHSAGHRIEYAILNRTNAGNRYASFSEGFPNTLAREIKLSWVVLAKVPTIEDLNTILHGKRIEQR